MVAAVAVAAEVMELVDHIEVLDLVVVAVLVDNQHSLDMSHFVVELCL